MTIKFNGLVTALKNCFWTQNFRYFAKKKRKLSITIPIIIFFGIVEAPNEYAENVEISRGTAVLCWHTMNILCINIRKVECKHESKTKFAF